MKRDERGYIVVETITAFTLFVFLMASILSLINIVTVQARVHYAITQAAETVSMYSYTLEAMGAADHMMGSAARSDKTEGQLNTLAGNINSVIGSIESLSLSGIGAAGEAMYQQGSEVARRVRDDPKDVFQNIMNYGVQKAGSVAFGELVRPLVGRYLGNGEQTGDEFLRSFRVIDGLQGLEFTTYDFLGWDSNANRITPSLESTRLLTSKGDVRIVVSYQIDYAFGILPLPFRTHTLAVTQEVVTKAWLGGLGKGYPKS